MHFNHHSLVIWGAFWALMAAIPRGFLGAKLPKRSMIARVPTPEASESMKVNPSIPASSITRSSEGPKHREFYFKQTIEPQKIRYGDMQATTTGSMEMGGRTSHQTWHKYGSSTSLTEKSAFATKRVFTHYEPASTFPSHGTIKAKSLLELVAPPNTNHPTAPLMLMNELDRTTTSATQHAQVSKEGLAKNTLRIEEIDDEKIAADGSEKKDSAINQVPTKSHSALLKPIVQLPEDDDGEVVHGSTQEDHTIKESHPERDNQEKPVHGSTKEDHSIKESQTVLETANVGQSSIHGPHSSYQDGKDSDSFKIKLLNGWNKLKGHLINLYQDLLSLMKKMTKKHES